MNDVLSVSPGREVAPEASHILAVPAKGQPLSQLPLRLHHYASVVRDQEVNRRFFEDILGIPLAATWCEQSVNPTLNRQVAYCHTLYALADGSTLAFFQFADEELYRLCKSMPEPGRFHHAAFKVDARTFEEIGGRLNDAGISTRLTDHGYARSLYVLTPDELKLEFVLDRTDAEEIAAAQKANAHAELARWLRGDHQPNNLLR